MQGVRDKGVYVGCTYRLEGGLLSCAVYTELWDLYRPIRHYLRLCFRGGGAAV
jgi:hypothetical protein